MGNAHFGNFADVFKHLALSELLGAMSPHEYWESHAGAASYLETQPPAAERAHGVHSFLRVAGDFDALKLSYYSRIVGSQLASDPPRVPGSPMLARMLLGDNVRRLLFCDIDAESLLNIRTPLPQRGSMKEVHIDKVECVQDDGVSVLRGAGLLLPEEWASGTLAFIDPYEIDAGTDAGISPIDLSCELANRGIVTLLFYAFADDAGRAKRQQQIHQALEKTRLLQRGACRFEGSLKADASPDLPTQWGFGLLAVNLQPNVSAVLDQKLRALEAAYARTSLPAPAEKTTGAWRYQHQLF